MKRRLATLAIVGAMTIAAMAPATVFAADNDTTTVNYNASGITPPTGNGSYYVNIPADVTLSTTGAAGAKAMNVTLHKSGVANTTLPDNLTVQVKVYSNTSYTLGTSGVYQLTYPITQSTGAAGDSDSPLANVKTGLSVDNADVAGTFSYDASWASMNANDVMATLAGKATLTTAPTETSGILNDTLTYYVVQTSADSAASNLGN